jgi:hypothetical protein
MLALCKKLEMIQKTRSSRYVLANWNLLEFSRRKKADISFLNGKSLLAIKLH